MKVLGKILPQRQLEQDIEDELAFHIEARTCRNEAGGMTPATARDEALRRFGDVEGIRESCREIGMERLRAQRRAELMDQIKRDIGYAIRTMLRRPGFAATAAFILALGIGGTTAIFSVVDGILLRPLALHQPERLVVLWGIETGLRSGSSAASYPDFVDIEESNTVFEEMAFWSSPTMAVTGPEGEPINVEGSRISHDLFPTLGVAPAIGRGFLPEEDREGAEPVLILGHGFWTSRFGRDMGVLGSTVAVDGVQRTVVGIMPPGFDMLFGKQIWIPGTPTHATDSRGQHRIIALGRLKPGVSIEAAEAEMRAIAARLETEYPEFNTNRSARLEPLHETVIGDVRPALLVLLGAVGVVLLIVCANVANLMLARGMTRGKEVAVRTALGASRPRLVRQFLTESAVLAVIGGALGVGIAFLGIDLLLATIPGDIPRIAEVAVDGRVLGFALLTTIVTGLLFGLIPALHGSKLDLHTALKEGSRTTSQGSSRTRVRQTLVVAEMALAVMLVAGAGLFVNSFLRLQRVDPGFNSERVLVVPISLPGSRYSADEWPKVIGFYDQLMERVASLPGVESVSAAYRHPLDGGWETSFQLLGVYERPQGERPEARIRPVTTEYFRTVGIPLIEGRSFTDRDDEHVPNVVIINQAFARAFFPDESPVGHILERWAWWPFQTGQFEIVGVVGDVKMDGVASTTPWAMYYPHRQMPFSEMQLLVRTAGDPIALAGAVRAEVWTLDSDLPLENIRSLEQIRADSVAPERFQTLLLGLFATLAIILAATGIYGVLSYAVAQRTGEIGIRISMGAETADVLRLVVGQGLRLTLAGVAVGLVGAFLSTRMISSLLFDVSPSDPLTFGAVAGTLVLVALAACTIPALRASQVDPVHALRAE
jgi:predicted permease